jgi:hypothetical protein
MKIYIAGGMTVMNVKGRERELSQKWDSWKRLFSYHYKVLIIKSEILNIVKDANKQNETATSTGDS